MSGDSEVDIEFILSQNTKYNADSVEWCPFYKYANYLLCGTYHLEEGASGPANRRQGDITLYKAFQNDKCILLQTAKIIESGGILDLKWCPNLIDGKPIFAAACSNGQTLVFRMSMTDDLLDLSEITCLKALDESNQMILSLDWLCPNNDLVEIVISDNFGNLNHAKMNESGLQSINKWKAHQFEAWISAFDYSEPNIIYSGGDDCLFKGWDTRTLSIPIFISKSHSMGVTSISKSKKNEHRLVTGSYDEKIFLWDTRSMKLPVSEVTVGGGVWRLKWHPHDPSLLISASMHNGFHIVSMSEEDSSLRTIAHYNNHKSLAYGVDWCLINQVDISMNLQYSSSEIHRNTSKSIVASCSFYDKLLHLWEINR